MVAQPLFQGQNLLLQNPIEARMENVFIHIVTDSSQISCWLYDKERTKFERYI